MVEKTSSFVWEERCETMYTLMVTLAICQSLLKAMQSLLDTQDSLIQCVYFFGDKPNYSTALSEFRKQSPSFHHIGTDIARDSFSKIKTGMAELQMKQALNNMIQIRQIQSELAQHRFVDNRARGAGF